jgi:hypothetical protein
LPTVGSRGHSLPGYSLNRFAVRCVVGEVAVEMFVNV